ncbi:WecB/TagA/CpsF family glycosyltransferase [Rhodococcus sp. T2V]|uniref:WecB/TagA/CpsF family glycosyltransferase n=1 Tax=Rhodococcus sp. T2V TaxID=3034164 RepID=UPI0023E22F65|nr:WecB/TagA/CpsF family glycosyltransferase [Rhodococcus sp. T2V]MDF3303405.1 WecB/TagA/CpsF family glycosyltransferase [Rhodococcus sp. T2V]
MITDVAGFRLWSTTYVRILEIHVDAVFGGNQFVSYALHIGGLNHRNDIEFRQVMNLADITYPDGASISMLARLSGARSVERCPTTDLGHDLLIECARRNGGERLRVALIGGTEELVRRARFAFEIQYGVEIVFAHNGFDPMSDDSFSNLRSANPHVVVVGMGMPIEAKFVEASRHLLPECLILTCGGWMGFVVGDENRAPKFLQDHGGEWLFRLAQSPRRLFRRYWSGIGSFGRVAWEITSGKFDSRAERVVK